jgi:hypothetical protein
MVLHAGFQKPVETGWFSRKPGKAIQPYFTELGFGEKTNICTVANGFWLVFSLVFAKLGCPGFFNPV